MHAMMSTAVAKKESSIHSSISVHLEHENTPRHSVWKTSVLFTLVTAIVLGIGYPLVVTGIAAVLFPRKAAGSLVLKDGRVIGSELLAQSFTSDRYFHPRPSAAGNGYDATASGATNLAPSNSKLVQRIQGDVDKLQALNPGKPVPIDMVTTSGSGLDPDITPDNAYYQAQRVALSRNLNVNQVRTLIAQHTAGRDLGFLGEPRVNVLDLNLALDQVSR
jgi:potassium-transporting ATPase KdpC subunit